MGDSSFNEWLDNFIVGMDNLHNVKGNSANIISRVTQLPNFDATLFQSLLEKKIQRRLLSELDGAHYRLLVVKWRSVLLPALHSCSIDQKALATLFDHYGEVSVFCYLFFPRVLTQDLADTMDHVLQA